MAVIVNFSPTAVDLTGIRAGDRNRMRIVLKSGGASWNLTNHTVAAQARLTPNGTEVLTAEVFMTDPVNGIVDLEWPGDDLFTLMGLLPAWRGVWDLQVTPNGQEPLTVAAGRFTAEMDVTRP